MLGAVTGVCVARSARAHNLESRGESEPASSAHFRTQQERRKSGILPIVHTSSAYTFWVQQSYGQARYWAKLRACTQCKCPSSEVELCVERVYVLTSESLHGEDRITLCTELLDSFVYQQTAFVVFWYGIVQQKEYT